MVSWPCRTPSCEGSLAWRKSDGRWWGRCSRCSYGTAAATGEARQLDEQLARQQSLTAEQAGGTGDGDGH